MFGIPDPWIWSAYLFSFLITGLCIGYSALHWNRGGSEDLLPEDKEWVKEEKEIEESL
jgi:hypothetical protein